MPYLSTPSPITALVYAEGRNIDETLRALALHLKQQSYALVGFVQTNMAEPGRVRCNMVLDELSSGIRISISEDRGPEARGCMLDTSELARASALASAGLNNRTDLLVINKFGKVEAAGGGFRPLIADALALEVPVLVAVPRSNLSAWRAFAGDLAIEHEQSVMSADAAQNAATLGFAWPAAGNRQHATTNIAVNA